MKMKKKMSNYKLSKKKLREYKEYLGIHKLDMIKYYEVNQEEYSTELSEEIRNLTKFSANSERCVLDIIEKAVIDAQENDLYIMSMREYIDGTVLGRYGESFESKFILLSEEHKGYDMYGLFGKKEEQVIVITHNIYSIAQEHFIKRNQESKVDKKERAVASYSYDIALFSNLLEGKVGERIKIPMHHFSEKCYTKYPYGMPYGIVLPYKEACASGKGKLSLRKCLENNLLMARAGSNMVQKYLFKKMQSNGAGYKTGGLFYFNHYYNMKDKMPKTEASYSLLTPYNGSIFAFSSFYEDGTLLLLPKKNLK